MFTCNEPGFVWDEGLGTFCFVVFFQFGGEVGGFADHGVLQPVFGSERGKDNAASDRRCID